MLQGEPAKFPPTIFESDKKQRFGITDTGEFIENVYREQTSSRLFGMIIGRQFVSPHAKSVFTSADVVAESYLYKKGSRMKNWKRRYFILRRDIRTLCYYDSRENLTLLGSIPLDMETKLANVKPEEADGFNNVVAMYTDNEDGTAARTLVRFDTFEKMKAWMLDIKNEAHNMSLPEEDSIDWWTALFDQIPLVEPKSSAVKRDALQQNHGAVSKKGASKNSVERAKINDDVREKRLHSNPLASSGDETGKKKGYQGRSLSAAPAFYAEPASDTVAQDYVDEVSSPHTDELSRERETSTGADSTNFSARATSTSNNITEGEESGRSGTLEEAGTPEDPDSDEESEVEDARISQELLSPSGKIKSAAALQAYRASHNVDHSNHGQSKHPHNSGSISGVKLSNKKIKHMKVEKPPGPSPFANPTAARFETNNNTMAGYQICLRLCNVCAHQDRIFVVFFANRSERKLHHSSGGSDQNITAAVSSTGGTTASSSSKLTQIWRTELYTISDKPAYGENYINEVKIHFSIMESLLDDNCKDIKIVVYRLENEMNVREPAKASNLSMQCPIAKTVIPKRLLDFKPMLKIAMHVLMDRPMDIAVPLFKEAEVTLGIVQMQSYVLRQQRLKLSTAFQSKPYAEIMYSFHTLTGQTISLEQLHASHYSISVAQALLSLWQAERNDFLVDITHTLRQELNIYNSEQDSVLMQDGIIEGADETGLNQIRASIEVLDQIQREALENAELVLQNCLNMQCGRDIVNNVIDPSVGGAWLRRSTWKKITAWQYCATNLNLHVLLSKHMTFADIVRYGGSDSDNSTSSTMKSSVIDTETKEVNGPAASSVDNAESGYGSSNNLHLVPTITVGVPAAHELKFGEGGLRKIFAEISNRDQVLRWIYAIQSPALLELQSLFSEYPNEALALFGSKFSMTCRADLAAVVRRKEEIARRLDVCGSQALGCAVTAVRTICMLAAQARGRHFDSLARSLKIGFLVMFQSMLSSQGAEMGMLEDLDIAALWLSLVTIRLVAPKDEGDKEASAISSVGGVSTDGADDEINGSRNASTDTARQNPSFVGQGEGITCRRDQGGRLIVDVEITPAEGKTVREAKHLMEDFRSLRTPVFQHESVWRFAFNPEPIFSSVDMEQQPQVVYATMELYGVVFSQGVNEMQTFANLSSSREVMRQVEVNNSSMASLDAYYKHYRVALHHQLTTMTPELLDALAWQNNSNIATAAASSGASLPDSARSPSSSTASSHAMRSGSASSPFSPGASSSSNQSSSFRRRKSLRQSLTTASMSQTPSSALTQAVETLKTKVLTSNDRLLDQLKEAVEWSKVNPHDKHVDVLLKSSALCRELGGTIAILCKSGKDRTSMGVTLEMARSLVEELGALDGEHIVNTMRLQGVRRMNVYANTGQPMFAFNQIQRIALPTCYRPPPGTFSGTVNS